MNTFDLIGKFDEIYVNPKEGDVIFNDEYKAYKYTDKWEEIKLPNIIKFLSIESMKMFIIDRCDKVIIYQGQYK